MKLDLNFSKFNFLKDKGFSCKGLEVSIDSVNRSKKYLKQNKIKNIKTLLWEKSPIIPFPSKSFDLVVWSSMCLL